MPVRDRHRAAAAGVNAAAVRSRRRYGRGRIHGNAAAFSVGVQAAEAGAAGGGRREGALAIAACVAVVDGDVVPAGSVNAGGVDNVYRQRVSVYVQRKRFACCHNDAVISDCRQQLDGLRVCHGGKRGGESVVLDQGIGDHAGIIRRLGRRRDRQEQRYEHRGGEQPGQRAFYHGRFLPCFNFYGKIKKLHPEYNGKNWMTKRKKANCH
ncbi:hypothetical protein SDC9_54763 [bioreactor metagenome]|uniref:Uncharacterized protein n=1 Tax=bioreactor metagenome TaxID=1076179 RepID=A0A644WXW3_9ZZZZ